MEEKEEVKVEETTEVKEEKVVEEPKKEKKSKKKNKKPLIIIIIVALIALGVGGYFIYENCIKDEKEESNKQEKPNTNPDEINEKDYGDKIVDHIESKWNENVKAKIKLNNETKIIEIIHTDLNSGAVGTRIIKVDGEVLNKRNSIYLDADGSTDIYIINNEIIMVFDNDQTEEDTINFYDKNLKQIKYDFNKELSKVDPGMHIVTLYDGLDNKGVVVNGNKISFYATRESNTFSVESDYKDIYYGDERVSECDGKGGILEKYANLDVAARYEMEYVGNNTFTNLKKIKSLGTVSETFKDTCKEVNNYVPEKLTPDTDDANKNIVINELNNLLTYLNREIKLDWYATEVTPLDTCNTMFINRKFKEEKDIFEGYNAVMYHCLHKAELIELDNTKESPFGGTMLLTRDQYNDYKKYFYEDLNVYAPDGLVDPTSEAYKKSDPYYDSNHYLGYLFDDGIDYPDGENYGVKNINKINDTTFEVEMVAKIKDNYDETDTNYTEYSGTFKVEVVGKYLKYSPLIFHKSK